MGSKTFSFRLSDDLATELEKAAANKNQNTTDFLRKLVDDALYPTAGNGAKLSEYKAKDENSDHEMIDSMWETVVALNEFVFSYGKDEDGDPNLQEFIKNTIVRLDKIEKDDESFDAALSVMRNYVEGLPGEQQLFSVLYEKLAGEFAAKFASIQRQLDNKEDKRITIELKANNG